MIVKRYGKNPYGGKDYIVGDIHGCYSKLQQKLKAIGFDETRDRLFCVGDLADRGRESELAYEWLSYSWFHAVKGNHEDMANEYFTGYLPRNGFIENGGKWFVDLEREHQRLIVEAFNALPYAIELETERGKVGIVHADCPVLDWNEIEEALTGWNKDGYQMRAIWDRTRHNFLKEGRSIKGNVLNVLAVVVGHSGVDKPTFIDNVLYIDTGAVFGGPFTIIDADTLQAV